MAAKRTPWFSPDVKPVHVGIYEVEVESGWMAWSHFDGVRWNGAWSSPEGAAMHADWFARYCGEGMATNLIKWRGLARRP